MRAWPNPNPNPNPTPTPEPSPNPNPYQVHESLGAAGGLEWEEGEACLGSLLVGFCDKLLADGVGALRAAMQDRHGTHVLRSLVRTL